MTRYIQRHSLLTRVTRGDHLHPACRYGPLRVLARARRLDYGGRVHLLDAHASPRVRYPVHSCSALCGV